VGRFASQLESVVSSLQFQRADCAPRSSLGNGAITVSDWVQAGRYAVGLDPLTAAGGPLSPEAGSGGGEVAPTQVSYLATDRIISVAPVRLVTGRKATVPVLIHSLGNENALGFSMNFDAAKIRIENVRLGRDADRVTLNVNTHWLGGGRLGVALSLPVGRSFSGGSQELVELVVSPATDEPGAVELNFGSVPVVQEVSDSLANVLDAAFQASVLEVVPVVQIALSGDAVVLSWPESAADYHLESAAELGNAAEWGPVQETAELDEGTIRVRVPLQAAGKFYRLWK
jgi:hypothetical protein